MLFERIITNNKVTKSNHMDVLDIITEQRSDLENKSNNQNKPLHIKCWFGLSPTSK